MITSSSSVIIILVLNIFFSTPSFVSTTETRNDDVTLPQLQTLVQQQGAIIQQQAALLQTLQAKLTADETIIHQQEVTIQQLQAKQSTMEARQNQNVAFTAGFNAGHNENIGEHGIIKFDKTITNIGGGYQTATGTFTAPIGGVYAFTLHIRSDNVHGHIFTEITKNGNTHLCTAAVEGPGKDQFDKCSCSAVVHLNVGEQVFARREAGADTFLEESEMTALTGFLVHAD